MKDEDSDLDLPDDRDSDSDAEENRLFRPRSMKGMMAAGTGIILHGSDNHNERCYLSSYRLLFLPVRPRHSSHR